MLATVYIFFSILLEGLQLFQKEAGREIRRFSEYKDRAAKRFHQLSKQADKNEKNIANLTYDIQTAYHHIGNLSEALNLQVDETVNLREVMSDLHTQLNTTHAEITSCCSITQLTNGKPEYSSTNQNNQKPAHDNKYLNIEIVEFGSGDFHDDIIPSFHKDSDIHASEKTDTGEHGSGETIYEGSGETVDGQSTVLPPFINVDLSSYVKREEFQHENTILKEMLGMYVNHYTNLTTKIKEMDMRITNIQLGNFMQSLQESLINFTQNVITLDQWKVSSTQIVNSTLSNQDQINKLTNMVVENSDKMADLRWKISSNELLSSQQFNILRMYVIRLNNSLEDMKEHISEIEKKMSKYVHSGNQYNGFYGYQSAFHPGNQPAGSLENGTNNDIPQDKFITLMSRLDELGLQVVFNQNRLGNLEVKLLNESLFTCRKYNMDSYQDSQLATHETVLKSNANSLMLIHELVKELDDTVQALNSEMKLNSKRIRTTTSKLNSLHKIIPAMVMIKKEVDHFKLQLPTG